MPKSDADADAVTLSLTGPASHTLVRKPGMGTVRIGPLVRGESRPDLVVGVDDVIDWSVFDPFTVRAGYPWPRQFQYHGSDTGFVDWSRSRPIEVFEWRPDSAVSIDASQARITRLTVTLRNAPMRIVLPRPQDGQTHFTVVGDPRQLRPELAAGSACPSLAFVADTRPARDADPLTLPHFAALSDARSVAVTVGALRQAFDCDSLLQFPGVRRVELGGALTRLASLASLRELVGLQLRYCPDLSGLPPLSTWPLLTHVLAFNVEESAGKRLRTEIDQLAKTAGRVWQHTSVSQLRRPEWFVSEYGSPFSGWPTKRASAAVKAHRTARAAITSATTPAQVEAAVRGFVRAVNALPDIDTIEREDLGEAVAQLVFGAPAGASAELAQSWFDDEREF